MMIKKLFGTDGIRGLANQHPITSEVAVKVGRALGVLLRNTKKRKPKVLIGKDTRISGYMIEMALASGLCSAGADVLLIGPMPTPGIAFLTQSMRCDAGVQISASHNPFYDNGIKIFGSDGFKIPDEWEERMEHLIQCPEEITYRPISENVGRAQRIDDALGRYIVHLKNTFPRDLDLQGMRLVLDCANGAFYKAAPLVFEELGAEVIRRGVTPTGLNINDQCGALHPELCASATTEYRADLGISLDGDGDRVLLVDETGDIVDGDKILAICALYLHEEGLLRSQSVVATPMSNMGLEVLLREHGMLLYRANVGDRYVVEEMRRRQAMLGGEQSGHIIFLDHTSTGDGVVAALKVLEIMRRRKLPLSELKKYMKVYPQVKKDVRISRREPLEKFPEIQKVIEQTEKKLGDQGRLFIRFSGTEPLLRILVEGPQLEQCEELAESLEIEIRKALG